MTESLIRTAGLGKTFETGGGQLHALQDIDLQIQVGESIAVMGPSGSGKSTLLHLLGCLDRPSEGHYWLAGEEVSQLDANRLARIRNQNIGFIFQTFNLLPRFTALENVELPLLYSRTPAQERKRYASEALARVGLGNRLESLPAQLSGGQQQRVAIARALVRNPAILLADEPTGSLDSRSGLEIMALFQALNHSGVTLILVTHETLLTQHTQRIVRFHDGRLMADLQNPNPLLAADLLARHPTRDVLQQPHRREGEA